MKAQDVERRLVSRVQGVCGLSVIDPVHSKEIAKGSSNNGQQTLNGMLVDLSEEGAGFITQEPLEPNSTIFLQFDPHEALADAPFRSKVVWKNPAENRYGAQLLVSEEEKDRVKSLLKRVGKSFVYNRNIYLPDTNAEGNAYFARYFDWQGETREAYLKQGITREEYVTMLRTKTRLVTVRASNEYYKPLWLFDEIRIRMTTRNIRHASLEMVFAVFKKLTGDLMARGSQELAFQNRHGRLIPVPPYIRRIALQIEEDKLSAEPAKNKA